MCPVIYNNNSNNKNDVIKIQHLTTTNLSPISSNLLKNQSKMILNVSEFSPTSESSDQTLSTIPVQSPVRDLLNPTNITQPSAIIQIPCNVDTASIHLIDSSIHVPSSIVQQINDVQPTLKTSPLPEALTSTTRKRRINEFPLIKNECESKDRNMDDIQPPNKITRLCDTSSIVKATKKIKDSLKSVDSLENIELNVNKCTVNALDDETVRNLSKGKILIKLK
jgi:hypothetical protein